MKASITVIKDTGVSFGELAISVLTLMTINAVIIIPAALFTHEVISSMA